MKHLKLFEDFVLNNQEGDLISYQDILDCIRKRGLIYADIILGFPDNDPSLPLEPMSIDEDGLISVKYLADIYNVKLKDVKKIEF